MAPSGLLSDTSTEDRPARPWLRWCFVSIAVIWTLATLASPIVSTVQSMILQAIEIAYECKGRGLTLHQCEHEIRVVLEARPW